MSARRHCAIGACSVTLALLAGCGPRYRVDQANVTESDRRSSLERPAPSKISSPLAPTADPVASQVPSPAPTPDARDLGPGADHETLPPKWRRPAQVDSSIPWPFQDTWRNQDASTFAIDVDSASFALARRYLREEDEVPAEIVRTEEFVNAFRYHYREPANSQPVGWDAAYRECPWNRAHRLLRVGVQAKSLARRQRPPCNLVFLVDVSGSMDRKDRLPLLKQAFTRLVDRLGEQDSVAIVTYAGSSRIVLRPTAGDDHRRLREAIDDLSSGGSTNGEGGIRTAYALARNAFRNDGQNRVILATDGDFNVGISDAQQLEDLIRDEARTGVFLTVLGVGDSTDGDQRMERLADRGNGQYHLLDSRDEADRVLDEGINASLVTVAQDVKIQVFFNPQRVRGWRLLGYENRALAKRDFNDDRVDGGEVGAGHQVTALYELIPVQEGGDANPFIGGAGQDEAGAIAGATADATADANAGPIARLRLRWQPPGGGASTLIEEDVANAARSLDAETAWAAAMAAWAESLRGRPLADRPQLLRLAERGLAGDTDGRRREALDLLNRNE